MLKENDYLQQLSPAMQTTFYRHLISLLTQIPLELLESIKKVSSQQPLPMPSRGVWSGDQQVGTGLWPDAMVRAISKNCGCNNPDGRK